MFSVTARQRINYDFVQNNIDYKILLFYYINLHKQSNLTL